MYSKEELDNFITEIENNYTYNDLVINEKVYVINELLKNTTDLIAPYMIDTEEDKKYVKQLEKALKILNELRCF